MHISLTLCQDCAWIWFKSNYFKVKKALPSKEHFYNPNLWESIKMILTSPSYLSSKTECCNVDYNLENLSRYHFLMHSIPFVYVLSLVDMTHSGAVVRESSACNFIEKETLAQVFSCKFCEIVVVAWLLLRNFSPIYLKDCFCKKQSICLQCFQWEHLKNNYSLIANNWFTST